jgi:YfiH family protein
MSLNKGEGVEVVANRRRFLTRLGLKIENLIVPGLAHSNRCEIVSKSDCERGALNLKKSIPATDALITGEKDVILAVTTADCLPIFIWSEDLSVIGIAHCGWKGLVSGICKNLAEKLLTLSPVSLNQIYVRIGVGIGSCCYIVDTGRLKKFHHSGLCNIHNREGEAVHLDLKACARMLLEREGVPERNISIESECSCCGENYPSYRGQGENFQPDLALICLKSR